MLLYDTALNGLWAGFCLLALVYFFLRERGSRSTSAWQRSCRFLAVVLACVSLFPCVSSSDDSVRFQYLQSAHRQQHRPNGDQSNSPDRSLATLVRLLEALESVQISIGWIIAVTLFSFALISARRQRSTDRVLPRQSGRAPPFASLQSCFR